ncbi:MAG: type II toxin-antitoxin system VapC family toxin [Desulfobacterales bacterium]|nr:type II toxin-antitoxin system VapC family toxin [Desulfobacterales bacterium]
MRLVLDTNIYCDYAEGVPSVVDSIAEFGEEIYLPAVVIAELTFGFMNGTKQEDNEKKLQHIIEQLQIEIIDINKDVARKYALIYLHLVKKGRRIPINDVWIAACCMKIGGTLLTRDSHFEAVELIDRLPIE